MAACRLLLLAPGPLRLALANTPGICGCCLQPLQDVPHCFQHAGNQLLALQQHDPADMRCCQSEQPCMTKQLQHMSLQTP
jgi:hypothetical protein